MERHSDKKKKSPINGWIESREGCILAGIWARVRRCVPRWHVDAACRSFETELNSGFRLYLQNYIHSFILNIETGFGIATCAIVNGHVITDEHESVIVTGGRYISRAPGKLAPAEGYACTFIHNRMTGKKQRIM